MEMNASINKNNTLIVVHQFEYSDLEEISEKAYSYLEKSGSVEIIFSDNFYNLDILPEDFPLFRYGFSPKGISSVKFFGDILGSIKSSREWIAYNTVSLLQMGEKSTENVAQYIVSNYSIVYSGPRLLFSNGRPITKMHTFKTENYKNTRKPPIGKLPVVRYASGVSEGLFFKNTKNSGEVDNDPLGISDEYYNSIKNSKIGTYYFLEPESTVFLDPGSYKRSLSKTKCIYELYSENNGENSFLDYVFKLSVHNLKLAIKSLILEDRIPIHVYSKEKVYNPYQKKSSSYDEDLDYYEISLDIEDDQEREDYQDHYHDIRFIIFKNMIDEYVEDVVNVLKGESGKHAYVNIKGINSKTGEYEPVYYALEDHLDQSLAISARILGYDVLVFEQVMGHSSVNAEVLDARDRTESFRNLIWYEE